ncbi:unnamed protein product [Ixodes persulcatus]
MHKDYNLLLEFLVSFPFDVQAFSKQNRQSHHCKCIQRTTLRLQSSGMKFKKTERGSHLLLGLSFL